MGQDSPATDRIRERCPGIAPAFSGERETDADALVIAHTLRTRDDLPAITPADPAQAQLHILTEHRRETYGWKPSLRWECLP